LKLHILLSNYDEMLLNEEHLTYIGRNEEQLVSQPPPPPCEGVEKRVKAAKPKRKTCEELLQ
jgi:hypothetical protein